MADPRLASIVDRSGDAALVAWAHHGTGSLAALTAPELAIAAAGELGNVAALQSVTEPKALRKAAAIALHRIKSRGVKVEDLPSARSFTLAREVLDIPPRAFFGAPNAMGNCHMLLTGTNFEGSCIMELIIGGPKVQDQHGHASRSELRAFWRDMEADPSLTDVPFLAALHIADRVVSGKSIHGWDHFLSKLAPGTLAAARAVDPLLSARPEVGAAVEGWVLPTSLVGGGVVDAVVNAMPQEGDPSNDSWLDLGVSSALEGAARDEFAVAADFAALVYTMLGRSAQAADAVDVAARLRAGEPGGNFPQLRSAVLLGAFQEIQHRQTEHQRDVESLMQRIGQQPRE